MKMERKNGEGKRAELLKKYAFLSPDPTLRNNLMAFGLDCGDGWLGLLERAFEKIDAELKASGIENFQAVQIKEKY